jgi:hypothetical protein
MTTDVAEHTETRSVAPAARAEQRTDAPSEKRKRGPFSLIMDGLTKYSLTVAGVVVKNLILLAFLAIFWKCSEHLREWVELQRLHTRIEVEQHQLFLQRYTAAANGHAASEAVKAHGGDDAIKAAAEVTLPGTTDAIKLGAGDAHGAPPVKPTGGK